MASVLNHEGVVSLDKEQVTQLREMAASAEMHGLSAPTAQTLRDLVQHLSQGEPVTVYPDETALTISQAANLFDIFPSNLDKRLDEGKIPFFEQGSQRYVYVRDMIAYDQAERAEQHELLGEILETSQEMGAYDPPQSSTQER
jgi:hypothetical protein